MGCNCGGGRAASIFRDSYSSSQPNNIGENTQPAVAQVRQPLLARILRKGKPTKEDSE